MALQSSGQISMGNIAIHMEEDTGFQQSLRGLSIFASYQAYSEFKPTATAPYSMSEFYGYNHIAEPPASSNYLVSLYSSCNGNYLGDFWINSPYFNTATIIASDSGLTTMAPQGFYSDLNDIAYWSDTDGKGAMELIRMSQCDPKLLLVGPDCYTLNDIIFTDSGDLVNATILAKDSKFEILADAGIYSDMVYNIIWDGRNITEVLSCDKK